ncbi:HBR146Cp [Eremothecium sinecaudum]|uniref:Dihydrofolate reductase n=1 Tax=Eremothecium sinecaudum TaxID=45286 RepID=A0A109UXC9_9SACH|nr:HBR146Cp [Eremothecium sinecaudum]AMD19047.1 HBR146Cp [Eremothecium sinecaudum]
MTSYKVPIVSIFACRVPDYGIGVKGKLPWRLSSDMTYFRDVTSSTFEPDKRNAVVMGKKTWDSMPKQFRPLKHRLNVVVSRSFTSQWEHSDIIRSNDLSKALQRLSDQSEELKLERIYVIGGAQIYDQTMHLCDNLLVTKVDPVTDEARSLEIDTQLDGERINKEFKENLDKLRGFIPPSVTLPQVGVWSEERGHRLQFSLYERSS